MTQPTNKAAKFTPGDWVLDQSHVRDDGIYIVAQGREFPIAIVGGSVWDASAGCAVLKAEDIANGRLLKAAPKLYEALRAIYTFPGVRELLAPNGSLGSIADQVEAALAEVEAQ